MSHAGLTSVVFNEMMISLWKHETILTRNLTGTTFCSM